MYDCCLCCSSNPFAVLLFIKRGNFWRIEYFTCISLLITHFLVYPSTALHQECQVFVVLYFWYCHAVIFNAPWTYDTFRSSYVCVHIMRSYYWRIFYVWCTWQGFYSFSLINSINHLSPLQLSFLGAISVLISLGFHHFLFIFSLFDSLIVEYHDLHFRFPLLSTYSISPANYSATFLLFYLLAWLYLYLWQHSPFQFCLK